MTGVQTCALPISLYVLKDSYAIEGITIVDDVLYVLNDGYYHDAETPINWIHEHNYTRVEKYASLMYVWRIFGCFSLEYKETSVHNLVEGQDNVKRMISTNEFRKAIKDAIKCNCGFKKNIFLLLMYFKCEPVIYKIFVKKR